MKNQHTLAESSPLAELLHLNLDDTLGAVFLGGLFTAILYGILCLQVYIFFNRFTKERLLLKYSVITLWMMSSLHLAFMIHPLYIFLIKDFANPFALLEVPWTIAAGVIPTCLTDAIVRCWFTYRIWILSKKCVVLITFLAALIVADFVTGIWIAVKAFETSQTLDSFNKTAWLFYTNLSMGIFTDMFIAAALCYQLYQRKSGYTSRNTNTVLNLLMIYAVNTGLFTAIVNIGSIITHAVMPSNYIFLAIYFTLGPLYVNALMGSLNARDWFRQQTTGKNHITIPLGSLHVSPAAKDEHSPDASSSAGGRSTDEYKPEGCIDITGGAKGDKVVPSV